MSRSIFIVILYTVFIVQAKFPNDPKPCKYGDTKCLLKIINYFLSEKAMHGDRDINLVRLDPLQVTKINIKQGAQSPVNIDLKFKNNTIYGLRSTILRNVNGFSKNISGTHQLKFWAPKLSLVGSYSIKGKVLILPISGIGKSNMSLVNCEGIITFTGKPYVKNGEIYMTTEDLRLTAKPERMYYHFTNLFNGDKVLGETMNRFINENWLLIYKELQLSIEEAFAGIAQSVILSVFSKYPYAQFFEV